MAEVIEKAERKTPLTLISWFLGILLTSWTLVDAYSSVLLEYNSLKTEVVSVKEDNQELIRRLETTNRKLDEVSQVQRGNEAVMSSMFTELRYLRREMTKYNSIEKAEHR